MPLANAIIIKKDLERSCVLTSERAEVKVEDFTAYFSLGGAGVVHGKDG